jgi:membrane-bound lytic murein transglycosylase D
VILAAGTPQILLPWDNATVFKRNFEAHTAGQYASWTAWRRHHHERHRSRTPGGHERGRLARVNNIPPRMLIKAGSVVLVPRTAKTENDVSLHLADEGGAAGQALRGEPQRMI